MNVNLWKWAARLFVVSLLAASSAVAEELKIEAKLIWGANTNKSPNPDHKPVDAKTAEMLRNVFAWQNYFEVSRTTGIVPNRGTNSFTVSKHCTVEIAELEGPKVGVLLIGKGKPQNRTIKALSRGESFVLGGDVKDGSAWFVIISQLDEKAAVANGKPAPPAAASNSKKSEESKVTNTASAKTTNTASK
jgi:hypothetical protein